MKNVITMIVMVFLVLLSGCWEIGEIGMDENVDTEYETDTGTEDTGEEVDTEYETDTGTETDTETDTEDETETCSAECLDEPCLCVRTVNVAGGILNAPYAIRDESGYPVIEESGTCCFGVGEDELLDIGIQYHVQFEEMAEYDLPSVNPESAMVVDTTIEIEGMYFFQ